MIALLAGCATIGTQSNADVVNITADGKVLLNGKQIPTASLSELFKKNAVIIEAHSHVRHDKVTAVMEEAKEAGITNVSFKTQNKQK